jgi:ankyrin repeat protein
VRLSHADGVKTLVEKGADVNVREYVEARSALYLAVEAGDIEIVRFLLDHGADVMARQEDGDTALHAAVRGGNKDMVSLLLEMGVNINEKGWYEETAFSRALASQRDDFAIFLLEKGADLEMHIDDPEHMALFEAAKTGCYRVVKFLVEREIRFKERRWGGDALSAAIEHGHTAVATFLIDQGADAAWRSEHNHKSLLYVAAEAGHEDMLKMLVEKGFDTNDSADHWVGRYRERHRFTRTALEAASAKGAVAAVEVLIEAGAEIGIRGYQGRTALHLAAKHGHDSVVSTLLRSGAGIDAHDDFGKTALHLAAEVGHDSVVTTLLRAGAGIDAHDDIGKTALHLAALSGHNSVVTTLLEAGAVINTIDHLGWTASHHAAFNRHKETVTMLIQSGSDINARTNSGETALHLVARSAQEGESLWTDEMESSDQVEDLEVAQLLLKQGANIQATNVDGINPLHLAAREGYPKITGLFLQHVVDIDATDEGGMTALHHAASYTAKPFSDYNKRTNFNLTMMLLRKGANVEIRDNAGRTPLFMAAANEDESMCRILLANGADGTAMLAVQPVDETYPKVDQVRKATERWRNINGQTARSTAEYLGQ